MVSVPQLSTSVLQNIADQISERIPQGSSLAEPGSPAGLGETLRVAMLTQQQIDTGTGPLAERLVETGQWHHQIYVNNYASSFARSVEAPGAPGAPSEVVEVSDATIADDLHRTIAWVDANVSQDGQAEVLVAPSHLLTAIWLYGPELDAVVVSSAPAEMGIASNILMTGQEFLETLAALPAVRGLGLPDDQNLTLGSDS